MGQAERGGYNGEFRGLDADQVSTLRTGRRAGPGSTRAFRSAVQGARPGRHLRAVLEGVGGRRGQGDQRVPPELPGPPAPRDAPAGVRGLPQARDMIHVEGLTKRYGERVLLEDVSW